jgi:hypothetical protein
METTEGQIMSLVKTAQEAWERADIAGASLDDVWLAMTQAVRAQVIEECARDMERLANVDLYASREWQLAAKAVRLLKEKKETT